MTLQQHLLQAEQALLRPETRRSPERLQQLLSADFIEIGTSGHQSDFSAVLASLGGSHYWAAKIGAVDFFQLSSDICRIIYTARIESGNPVQTTWSRRTSIWRLEGDNWKMVLHQGSRLTLVPEEIELQ